MPKLLLILLTLISSCFLPVNRAATVGCMWQDERLALRELFSANGMFLLTPALALAGQFILLISLFARENLLIKTGVIFLWLAFANSFFYAFGEMMPVFLLPCIAFIAVSIGLYWLARKI